MSITPGGADILLGHLTKGASTAVAIESDSPELTPHKHRPWLHDYIARRHNIVVASRPDATAKGQPFSIHSDILKRHTLIIGRAGSGKTRLAMLLLEEQLKAGCSGMLIDVQDKTLSMALLVAERAGLKPDQITVVWSRDGTHGVPGWNPFAVPLSDVESTVSQFTDLIHQSVGANFGIRMEDVLINAATIVASQGLSILELVEFLQDKDYRNALLKQAAASPAREEFKEEFKYFDREFSKLTTRDQEEFARPILTRIRKLVRNKFLRAMLCSKTDTLDIPSLWQRQRLILILLDKHSLGMENTKLLAGMLTNTVLSAAMTRQGAVPVVLCLDEMGLQGKFSGEAIDDILAGARQRNVRVMAACQQLYPLPESLKKGLLTSTSLRAYFALGEGDDRLIAHQLCTGADVVYSKIAISAKDDVETYKMYIVDETDTQISLGETFWTQLQRSTNTLATILDFADRSSMTLSIQYGSHRIPLASCLQGLPTTEWRFVERSPLSLHISFQRPDVHVVTKKTGTDQIAQMQSTLGKLQEAHAIVWADGRTASLRISPVPFPGDVGVPGELPRVEEFLGGGQSAEEIISTEVWRTAQIDALTGRTAPQQAAPSQHPVPLSEPEIAPDGSL